MTEQTPDFQYWTLKIGYTNGLVQYFQIPKTQVERLRNNLQTAQDRDCNSMVFSSDSYHVCLAMDHVLVCQFLMDVGEYADHSKIHSRRVAIFFHNQTRPIYFICEPDNCKMDEENYYEDVQFQYLMYRWQIALPESESHLRIIDEDGEEVFLNRQHIAAILIPKSLSDLELRPDENLSDEEFEALIPGASAYKEGDGKFHGLESWWAAGEEP